jgi:RNA 2',3'-cyclic 3'-phosphodiesterase
MSAELGAGAAEEAALLRLFVAVDLDDATRARLAETLDALRESRAPVAWVPAPNLHVSMAFLGPTPRDQVDMIGDALREAAAGVPPFTFAVAGLGSFGSAQSPRVIWAGLEPCEPLAALYARVRDTLAVLDIRLDARPFRAHVTLGRVRTPRGRDDLLRALAAAGQPRFGAVSAAQLTPYRSVLLPSGALYTALRRVPLGG